MPLHFTPTLTPTPNQHLIYTRLHWEVPWIFDSLNLDLLKLVHTPMSTSQICAKAVAPKNNKRKAEQDKKPKQKAKAKAKSKGKGKGNPDGDSGGDGWNKVVQSAETIVKCDDTSADTDFTEDLHVEGVEPSQPGANMSNESSSPELFCGPDDAEMEDMTRPALWLDDVINSLEKVINYEFKKGVDGEWILPRGVSQAMLHRVMGFYISTSLEFCWAKSITFNQKQMKQWSQFRPALQDMLHKAFAEMKSAGNDSTTGTVSGVNSNTGPGTSATSATIFGFNNNQAVVASLLRAAATTEDINFREWSWLGWLVTGKS